MDYIPENVDIKFAVGNGHAPGDYVYLHSNGGSGDIDWVTPHDNRKYYLFPANTGYFGFGHVTWGNYDDFGHGESRSPTGSTDDFGYLPFGHFPWGHSSTYVQARVSVQTTGYWRFGFAAYDSIDNAYAGTASEVLIHICLLPKAIDPLLVSTYDDAADLLTLITA